MRPVAAAHEIWSSENRGREAFLEAISERCQSLGWPVSRGDAWSRWDLEILSRPRDRVLYLTTVTEYHAEGALTKVRVETADGAAVLPRELLSCLS